MKKSTSRKPARYKTAGRSSASASGRRQLQTWPPNRRKIVVFFSLLLVLTFTSLLLKAMARNPMQPDAADTLFAYGTGDSIDAIFNMQSPVEPGHWQYLYIHHSKTPGGNALSLSGLDGIGDHFVIGNGDGLADGELQISQRWNHQQPAVSPSDNVVAVRPDCISICLVGDLDRKPPTPMQLGRLGQLAQALQTRCRIPAGRVEWLTDSASAPLAGSSAAGIGHLFPAAAFRDQLRSWPTP